MNKTVLITGASSGIGKETARTLAKAGYKVYGAARNTARMNDLAKDGIQIISLDVASEASMEAAVRQITDTEGGIDILINNAGFGEYGPIEDVSMKDARYQLEVNLFGGVRLAQLILPSMRKNKWGKIVNVTSIGGKIAMPFGGWYHASKFALEGLSDSLRNEVKPFGIDVIVIEPGAVKTEWGNIAVQNMLKNALNSPYYQSVQKRHNSMKVSNGNGSEPQVIADLIKTAIEVSDPKARYHGGAFADDILGARKRMSDEEFDTMMNKMFE